MKQLKEAIKNQKISNMKTQSIFRKFENLEDELVKRAFDVYQNSSSDYNTDLIVDSQGNIREHNYFGNVTHMGSDIEFVLKITTQDKIAWADVWTDGMTSEQIEFCEENNWQCVCETDSVNSEDWQEYKVDISDFSNSAEYISELISYYEEELEEINEFKN